MAPIFHSRRHFLQQSFAFSAAAALSGLTGCGTSQGALAPAAAAPLTPVVPEVAHLLMVGDFGETSSTAQATVAAAMASYVKTAGISAEALLMLGDNFYGDLTGLTDPRWQSGFEQMYPASVFPGPCYAIPGNHDYQLGPGQKFPIELAYAAQGNTRWTMPSPYYTFLFPKVNPLITFIALDSNIPYPSGATSSGSFYTMSEADRQKQLAWFKAQLTLTPNTPFTAVMAHHPLYSDGPHGDNPGLIADWDSLLRQYNVQLCLGGHDHDLQHLEFTGHPTSFFLSGAGGQNLYDLTISPTTRGPYAQKMYGFSHLEATKELITLRHVASDGTVLHAFTKTSQGVVTILV